MKETFFCSAWEGLTFVQTQEVIPVRKRQKDQKRHRVLKSDKQFSKREEAEKSPLILPKLGHKLFNLVGQGKELKRTRDRPFMLHTVLKFKIYSFSIV